MGGGDYWYGQSGGVSFIYLDAGEAFLMFWLFLNGCAARLEWNCRDNVRDEIRTCETRQHFFVNMQERKK